jgi:hypothetical protein
LLNIFFDKNYDFILKGLEKQTSKYMLFLFLFISNLLIISIAVEDEKEKKILIEFADTIRDFSKIKFDQGNVFKKINDLYK